MSKLYMLYAIVAIITILAFTLCMSAANIAVILVPTYAAFIMMYAAIHKEDKDSKP